jgi:hypothetical protein
VRLISSGTPSRTKEYVYPRKRLPLIVLSLAAGLAVTAALTIAVLSGRKTLATPGPLSSPHAPFEAKCAACHAPAVADVRCEYCHDPFGSNRYRNAGHVWFGTKDPARVEKAKMIDCAFCHSDHHGRKFSMALVDERECARCHFSSMARHPEFSLVKAGVMKGEGILFTHDRHVNEVRKIRQDRCQYCHEPTADRSGFQPLSFDRHCARCHAKDGILSPGAATDPIPRRALLLPEDIDQPWTASLAVQTMGRGGAKVVVDKLRHRDPWVICNLWRISRAIDPEGLAIKRARIVKKIQELEYKLSEPPTRGMSRALLLREEQRLNRLVGALSGKTSTDSDRSRAERSLARIRVQIELEPLQMSAPRGRDRSQLEGELALRRQDLADFDTCSGDFGGPVEREEQLVAAKGMTAPCTKCHIYDASLMRPVNAAVAVLEHAKFNHRPHVQQVEIQQAGCETCHANISTSKKAEQVNLPGVANCMNCHRPGKTRDDCAECHLYHPPTEPWPPI